jgi:superfamily I DNA and/or RNA helicase
MKTILEIINEKQKKNYMPTLPITISSLNKAQLSTIKEIEKNNLVVVTGCAGSGKTSTIVNVASHFLAKNKKVLIVSKNDKAVDVIADRLNSLNAPYLALRSGNKNCKNELSEKLKTLLDNKVKLELNNENFLTYLLKGMKHDDAKKLLANKRVLALKLLLADTDKRKRLIIHSKALVTSKRTAREKLLKEDFSPILEAFPCWCCTTMQISESLPLIRGMFDLVIIDEASQCDIASSIPIFFRAKKALVVGDEKQLKHISWLEKSKEQSFLTKHNVSEDLQLIWRYRTNSLFDFASYYAEKSILLDIQYRSPKNVMEFANNQFYNGAITSFKGDEETALRKILINGKIDEKGVNQAEIERIIHLIKSNRHKGSIGILSPFRTQVTAIEKAIIDNFSYDEIKANKITVGTAHSFQGDEKDIMIISWVIADNSPYQSQTFVNNDNLFNVAITRGKEQVINLYSTNNLKDTLLKKYLDSIN